MGPAPDALDVMFCHIRDHHPEVYDDERWHGLADLAIRGIDVDTDPQCWAPGDDVRDLQHPVAVMPPTSDQLTSSVVAARWAACQTFHCAVKSRGKGRPRKPGGG